MRSIALASMLMATTCAFFTPGKTAHAQSSPAPTATAPAPQSDVTDQKIDAVVAAAKRVQGVKKDYDKRLAALATEAQQAVESAVTKQGLTVQEYEAILKKAQTDPAVRQKIVEKLKPAPQRGM